MSFYYVYVLRSSDKRFYTGWTTHLKERFRKNNEGKVEPTKSRRPLTLIFYEAFLSKKDALDREKFLKAGWGRRHLKQALKDTLK